MRWAEIIGESNDVLADARTFILQVLAPLKAQGVASITVDQVLDQLRANPDFQGQAIDQQFVMDALKNIKDVTIEPDMDADGKMSVKFDSLTKSRQVDDAEQAQDTKDLKKSALRSLSRKQED